MWPQATRFPCDFHVWFGEMLRSGFTGASEIRPYREGTTIFILLGWLRETSHIKRSTVLCEHLCSHKGTRMSQMPLTAGLSSISSPRALDACSRPTNSFVASWYLIRGSRRSIPSPPRSCPTALVGKQFGSSSALYIIPTNLSRYYRSADPRHQRAPKAITVYVYNARARVIQGPCLHLLLH
jgi:hypothetical protein